MRPVSRLFGRHSTSWFQHSSLPILPLYIHIIMRGIGNENYNKWHSNFFLNCNQHFGNQTMAVSECCLIKLLFDNIYRVIKIKFNQLVWENVRIFYLKNIFTFYHWNGIGQPREAALCQMYRHTFVAYNRENFSDWGRYLLRLETHAKSI